MTEKRPDFRQNFITLRKMQKEICGDKPCWRCPFNGCNNTCALEAAIIQLRWYYGW